MKDNPNEWTEAECFLFGALISSGRYFWNGEGNTGKKLEYYQSSDGSIGSVISRPDNEN
jgi:hypothetical protein